MWKAAPTKLCTPKSQLEKRICGSKLLKIPYDRQGYIEVNTMPSVEIDIKKHYFSKRDRKLQGEDTGNPFDLPKHNRLFIFSKYKKESKPEPFIMSEPRTICDIDETFYKVIEGRPLRVRDDVKTYIKNIRDVTLNRANAAYLRDQLIEIDTALADEVTEYNKVSDFFEQTKENFVQFAKESYKMGKFIQEIAEERGQRLAKVVESLESCSFKYVKVRNQVSAITAVLDILDRYRKFLVSISPEKWREQYENDLIEEKKICVVVASDEELEPVDADESIVFYRKSLTQLQKIKPVLYFKDPEELMHVYDDMCAQCLNYMQVDAMTNPLVSSVLKEESKLKTEIVEEVAEITDVVNAYKEHVEFLEEKENAYKALFHKLLMNSFQKLYSSEDTIKLFSFLQYTHKQLFGSSDDPRDNIVTVTLQLELHYNELCLGIDGLNQDVVKSTANELFSKDIKMMKRAHNAQRSLKECDILKKAIYKSFEPSRSTRK